MHGDTLCMCGCGQLTTTRKNRYLRGHNNIGRQIYGTAEQRFWRKMLICEHGVQCEQCCWLWQASTASGGYGQLWFQGKFIPAHVFAYQLQYGVIQQRVERHIEVCHVCDNPPCCNWHHLFTDTHKGNMEDMTRKQRQAVGEQNGYAKLTTQDIQRIFTLKAEGKSLRVIAQMVGCSYGHIGHILRGNWRQRG